MIVVAELGCSYDCERFSLHIMIQEIWIWINIVRHIEECEMNHISA